MLTLPYILRRLNLGPLHGISLTSFSEVARKLHQPTSVGNVDIQSLFDADWRSQPFRPSRINRPFDALSGSSDVDVIHDHPSPADMDFVPDAVSSYLSGTRDRDADRYNAGPNPPH